MSRLPFPVLVLLCLSLAYSGVYLLPGYLNPSPPVPSLSIVKSANHAYGAALAVDNKGTNGGDRGEDEPVAVFVGGTSGIGRAMAESFSHHTKGRGRVVLVGRNERGAHAILSSTPSSSNAKNQFIPCDLANNTSLSLCIDALSTLPKINYLILTLGLLLIAPPLGRQPPLPRIPSLSIVESANYTYGADIYRYCSKIDASDSSKIILS